MKTLKAVIAGCILVGVLSSCKEDGKVVFKNRSVTNRTYTVVWDGAVITTLYPQMDSDTIEVKEGPHTLLFKFSNSNETACSEAQPVIGDGEIRIFICSN